MTVQSNSIFGTLANQFRNSDSLFFDSQLSTESIHSACRALGHKFRDRIYSPAVTVWMFIGQVLSADQSCRDAIARLNVWRVARGKCPASIDSACYVEARHDNDYLSNCCSNWHEPAARSVPTKLTGIVYGRVESLRR